MRLGVDFSQWGGALSQSTIQCWRAQGVDHAIVQYSALMRQHFQALQGSGIETEAYVYLYWGQSPWGQTPVQRTKECIDIMDFYGIKVLWLDAEDSTHPYNEAQLEECENYCYSRNIIPGIYTGRWWWVPNTGNSQAFNHLPLWDANYLAEASIPNVGLLPPNFDGYKPYGGWLSPTIWQWHNTTSLCGHSVDLNALRDSSIPTPIPQEVIKDMRIIQDPNGAMYLAFSDKIAWIPNQLIADELIALVYSNQPKQISWDTWGWLNETMLDGNNEPIAIKFTRVNDGVIR